MTGSSKEKNLLISISAAALFIACLPLFSGNCINGHDISYHLLRIEALKEGILAGRPFTKVNLLFFGGRGYASSLFYPDLFLYLPALLRCAHVPINLSFHIFVAFCIVAAFLSMYFCVRLIAVHFMKGDRLGAMTAGVIAAVCYTLAQYHLDDIYTRSAVGEYTAMIFLPPAIYGLYDMLIGGMKRPALMAVAFAGLILCHTTTTVFVLGIYMAVFLISLAHRCIRGRMRASWLLRIIAAGAGALLLTAFYWVPVLEQFADSTFQTGAAGFDLDYEKLPLMEVFLNKNPALGIALPLITFIAAQLARLKGREKKLSFAADIMALLAVICTLFSTGLLPWKRLQGVLGFVQFPWRLFVAATALFAVALALYISAAATGFYEKRDKVLLGFAVGMSALMIVSAILNFGRMDEGYYSYSDDYYSYVPFTGSVIGGEWLPQRVTDRDGLIKDCDTAYMSYGGEAVVSRSAGALSLVMPAKADYVDVPFIYYKGYAAVAENGRALALDGNGKNGSVRVYSPPEGGVTVYYAGTAAQRLSALVSGLFLVIAALLSLRFKGKRK